MLLLSYVILTTCADRKKSLKEAEREKSKPGVFYLFSDSRGLRSEDGFEVLNCRSLAT
jgi:hypothetical protein